MKHLTVIIILIVVVISINVYVYLVAVKGIAVLKGIGTFIDGNDLKTLRANESMYFKKDEIRGIKAIEDLVVLGIQDRPKEESAL